MLKLLLSRGLLNLDILENAFYKEATSNRKILLDLGLKLGSLGKYSNPCRYPFYLAADDVFVACFFEVKVHVLKFSKKKLLFV